MAWRTPLCFTSPPRGKRQRPPPARTPRDERGPEAARGRGRRLRRADKHQAVRRAGRAAQIPAGQACQAQEEARRGRRRRRRRRCGARGVAWRAQEGEDGRAQAEPRRREDLRSTLFIWNFAAYVCFTTAFPATTVGECSWWDSLV